MTLLKKLEGLGKTLLAWLGVLFLSRSGRKRLALQRLRHPKRVLLVRPDNRVGEALLMTPVFHAVRARLGDRVQLDVLLHRRVTRVLEGHPLVNEVMGLDRRGLALGALAPGIRALRARSYDVVINCGNWDAPSVTAALVARLVGPRAAVVGPAIGVPGRLHDVPVPPALDGVSEVMQRLQLLTPLGVPTGSRALLSFRPPRVGPGFHQTLERLGGKPFAVVNPGGRLGYRCLPSSVFTIAARKLAALGITPLVTWGPGEEELARDVARGVNGSEVAAATTLDDLAALMARGQLTVCNNTGPMHLSVAVGAPTLALFLFMPVERWGHSDAPHLMLDLTAPHARGEALGPLVESAVAQMLGARFSPGRD